MVPLVLITGYLGAGKTTFLRNLLPVLVARGLRPRVILNDYGDARVDAATMMGLVPDLMPISGSCVCCETQEALLTALAEMKVVPGDVVLIEPNGTTDAASLVELLSLTPGMDALSLPTDIVVVDAQRMGTRGWQNTIEEEQIVPANAFALSRLDLVEPSRVETVRAEIQRLAPTAKQVNLETLADWIVDLSAKLAPIPGRPTLQESAFAKNESAHALSHLFSAFSVPLPTPVDIDAFTQFLRELPPEIVRAKGILLVQDPPGEKRTFQKVGDFAEVSPCALFEDLDDPQNTKLPAPLVGVFVGTAAISMTVRARLAKLLAAKT